MNEAWQVVKVENGRQTLIGEPVNDPDEAYGIREQERRALPRGSSATFRIVPNQ